MAENNNVLQFSGKQAPLDPTTQSAEVSPMAETPPTREEIAARLEAAVARTESRITQLSANFDIRFERIDHKFDTMIERMMSLEARFDKILVDNGMTRRAIYTTGVGAIVAVLALVVALWGAGLSIQGNMLSAFQAGLVGKQETAMKPSK